MPSLLDRPVPSNVVARLRRRMAEPEPRARITLSERELFEILADNRRRVAIDRLAEGGCEEAVPRRDLAREIAAAEMHMRPEHVPDERVDRIDGELQERHFPVLDEAGLVRWNVAEETVSPGHSLGPVAEWLDDLRRHLDPLPHGERPYRIDTSTPSWG